MSIDEMGAALEMFHTHGAGILESDSGSLSYTKLCDIKDPQLYDNIKNETDSLWILKRVENRADIFKVNRNKAIEHLEKFIT